MPAPSFPPAVSKDPRPGAGLPRRGLSRSKGWLRAALAALLLLVVMAVAYPLWRPWVHDTRWFVIASNVGEDSMRRFGLKSAQIGQDGFAPPADSEIEPETARMRHVYDQYLRYSGISRTDVPGKRVLELGPGRTLSIPLLFVADGASYVAGVDRFAPFQVGPYYQKFYTRLREPLDPAEKARFDRAIRLDTLALNPQLAADISNRDLPDVVDTLGPESYDLIVSNAVMEEIYDPTPVLRAQDRLLRPGGTMVHLIDLRDYGMFSKRGFHPLEFLTVPNWVYRFMVEGSGQPDRRMLGYYRDAAVRMGYDWRIYTSHILGHPDVMPEPKARIVKGVDYTDADVALLNSIRPRLQPEFRSLPDEELLAQSIIFSARKPSASVGDADRSKPQ